MDARITATTGLLALIGSPVDHSRSPAVHNAAFRALGLDYVYLAFDIGRERVGDAIGAMRTLRMRGANVTMPLKRDICSYMDDLSPIARLAGAVNTIVNTDGHLAGHITDGQGYLMGLRDAGVDVRGRKITIVGAGGAATAIALEAAGAGAGQITLFNLRDAFFAEGERAAALLREGFHCPAEVLDLADADALRRELANSDILVNGTPIGMHATRDRCVIPDASYFHPRLVVTDLIYEPAETKLLRVAREAGCLTVNGRGMQLHQGALSFKLWTGRDMPLDAAREAAP
jgi:shikimate dehydrogenase